MEVEYHFQHLRAKWGVPVVVQEFVAGEEFDVVAVGDGRGGLVGSVAMRKMQLTDKGKAWGGITINDGRLGAFVEKVIKAIGWRGPCEIEVMKARDGGKLYLLEINPRFPAWVYLAVGAGRNLPWATVRLALGEEVPPMPPAPAGVMFLRHSFDQICELADYQMLTTQGELHCPEENS
jgi:carbamoyl-phosphate synthase large subunit